MAEQSLQNSAPARQPTKAEIATAKISGIPLPENTSQQSTPGEHAQPKPQVQDAGGEFAEAGDSPAGEQTEGLEAQSQETEMEEVEFEGFNIPLPKDKAQAVKDALMRQADYTRKTQEVAEARRDVIQREQMLQAQAQFHQSAIEDIALIRGIDSQLKQFEAVNWQGLDTDTLVRTKHQFDQLKDVRDKAEKALQQKAQQFEAQRSQYMRKLSEDGFNHASQKAKDLSTEKGRAEWKKFLSNEGFQDQEIGMFFDPRLILLSHKAMQFDKLQQSRPEIQNRAKSAPPVVKPGAASKPANREDFLKGKLANAKTPREKEIWGTELLARKLRI